MWARTGPIQASGRSSIFFVRKIACTFSLLILISSFTLQLEYWSSLRPGPEYAQSRMVGFEVYASIAEQSKCMNGGMALSWAASWALAHQHLQGSLLHSRGQRFCARRPRSTLSESTLLKKNLLSKSLPQPRTRLSSCLSFGLRTRHSSSRQSLPRFTTFTRALDRLYPRAWQL